MLSTEKWIKSLEHSSADHLINLFIGLIMAGSKSRMSALRKLIISRMRSDSNLLKVMPSVEGKPFKTTPPTFNPEGDLPGGLIPDHPDIIYPDGGGPPIEGDWVQSDGGRPMFEPERIPDGQSLANFMQGVQRDSEKMHTRQKELADALQEVYRENHPDDVVCPHCTHAMFLENDGFCCANCGTIVQLSERVA